MVQEGQGAGAESGEVHGGGGCATGEEAEQVGEGDAGGEGEVAVVVEDDVLGDGAFAGQGVEEVGAGGEDGAAVGMGREAANLMQAVERRPQGVLLSSEAPDSPDMLGVVQELQQAQQVQWQEGQQQDKKQQEQRRGQLLPAPADSVAADSNAVGAMWVAPTSAFNGAAPAVNAVVPQVPAPNAAPQALPVFAAPQAPFPSAGAASQAPFPSTAAAGPSPPPPQTAGWDWVPALELPAASAAGTGAGAGSRPSLAGRQQQPKQQQLKQRLTQGLWQPEPWVLKVRHDGVQGSFLKHAGGYVEVGNT